LVRFLNGREQLRKQWISQEEFMCQWDLPNLPPFSYRSQHVVELEENKLTSET
jgi:hypothetical protein